MSIFPDNCLLLSFFYLTMSHVMRKLDFCLCENKGADQLRSNCEADQSLCFALHGQYNSSSTYILNFEPLSIYCACKTCFLSDLFGNHIIRFLMTWLICVPILLTMPYYSTQTLISIKTVYPFTAHTGNLTIKILLQIYSKTITVQTCHLVFALPASASRRLAETMKTP